MLPLTLIKSHETIHTASQQHGQHLVQSTSVFKAASLKFISRFRFCLVFFLCVLSCFDFCPHAGPDSNSPPPPPITTPLTALFRAVWRSSCHRQHLGFRQRSTVFLSALGISHLQQLSTFFESLPSTCSIAALLCNERCRFSQIVFEGLTLTSRHYRREDPGTHHQPRWRISGDRWTCSKGRCAPG